VRGETGIITEITDWEMFIRKDTIHEGLLRHWNNELQMTVETAAEYLGKFTFVQSTALVVPIQQLPRTT
jgi:hypothetical protein